MRIAGIESLRALDLPRSCATPPFSSFFTRAAFRVSEAVGLLSKAWTMLEQLVRVFGKGSKERVVPVHEIALGLMRDYERSARPVLLDGVEKRLFSSSDVGESR